MAMDKEREALVARLGELAGELSALASIQPVTGHLVERTLRSSAFCMRQAIAALTAQQEPVACCCGEPMTLGAVHRKDKPCFYWQDTAPPSGVEWRPLPPLPKGE